MEPGCPWSGWAPGNLRFCEAELCSWVREPANTWTNAGFLVVGFWLLGRQGRWRVLGGRAGPLILVPLAAILTGVGSSLFHASKTYAMQLVDFGAMFLLSAFLLLANLRRRRSFSDARFFAGYVALVAGSILAMGATRSTGIELFGAQVVLVLLLEADLFRREQARGGSYDLRPFRALLATFGAAYVAWLLDYHRIACDPDLHWISGHGVWHLLNALCFVWIDRFYSQFPAMVVRSRTI